MNTTKLQTLKNRLDILQTLNDRFAISDHLELAAGRGGVPVVEIQNDLAEATVSLEGGQIISFRPRDQYPVLWYSPFVPINQKKPIRGGIPICWPWFGPHSTNKNQPAHGFARTALWTLIDTKVVENGATQMTLELVDNEATNALWRHSFRLQMIITVGIQLQVELVTQNTGNETFIIGEALHSYFNVSDATQIIIYGLHNKLFIDKVDDQDQYKEQKSPVMIRAETDRVYLNTTAECFIEDPGFQRRIRIAKQGSHSTVIWNPWIEKAARLGDLGYQGYLRMVCVETANAAENLVEVAPGEAHCLQAVIGVEA
jgi:glucose-6-phosphate 1-epimerase